MDNKTAEELLQALAQEKQANSASLSQAVAATTGEMAKQQALADIKKVMLISLGGGAALRGLSGIHNVITRNLRPPVKAKERVVPMPIPVPINEKLASTSYFNSPVTKKDSIWFHYPGMLLSGLGAGALGYKGVDVVLDSQRKQQLKDEEQKAREQFRKAILESYTTFKPKIASVVEEDDLASSLNKLAEQHEKTALTLGDVVGKMTNSYAGYAVPSGLLAAYMAYNVGSQGQRKKVLEKAIKQRARQQAEMQPSMLYATPTAVPVLGSSEESI